jgi:hypothetical protein
MSARHGDLTAADVAWAVEVALSSHQDRWVEHQITGAAGRDEAIDAARHILTSWGTFSRDGRVAGQPFAAAGFLTVERDGRSGLISFAHLVDAVRTGSPAWQGALF